MQITLGEVRGQVAAID